jgi:hypothetical protein
MDLKPGDRIWISWPRERGERGLVVDTARGVGEHEAWREREHSLVRFDPYLKRVRVNDGEARLTLADGTEARVKPSETGPGYWYGEVVESHA